MQRNFPLTLTVLLALVTIGLAQPPESKKQPPADSYQTDAILELVAKLGSASFAQREKARANLEALGPHVALEPLKRIKKSNDAELNRRVADLIRRLEDQLLTEQILAPKMVDLKLDGLSVRQSISELAKASGYPIEFLGDATKFADKRITLNGKMTFWQAIDQLCEQAGLKEHVDGLLPYFGERHRAPVAPNGPGGAIVLINRAKEQSWVSHSGAVKSEIRIRRDATLKEVVVEFIVSAEPRLLNNSLSGAPHLDKALDERGLTFQSSVGIPFAKPGAKVPKADIFAVNVPEVIPVHRRVRHVRLRDEMSAKQIKELFGKLTLQLDLQNELIAKLDNVLDSAGKSADGVNGGRLKVLSINKKPGGSLEMQIALENLVSNPFGNNIQFNGNGGVIIQGNIQINGGGGIVIGPGGVRVNGNGGNRKDLPDLLDSKGQKYAIHDVTGDSFVVNNGSASRTVTILYVPNAGQTEPRELVLFGTRTHLVTVPFRFENVPLP